jgi:hypothetical protein
LSYVTVSSRSQVWRANLPAHEDYATNETFRAKMKGYTDLYVTGSREILQIV